MGGKRVLSIHTPVFRNFNGGGSLRVIALSFLFMTFYFSNLHSQSAPAIEWQKSLGGIIDDIAYYVQQTSDGGYIVGGYSLSNNGDVSSNHGNNDYWIVKLDSSANITWQKCLGGSNIDKAYSVQQTTDGGFIVAGESLSTDLNVTGNHGSYDCWVVKLDSSGGISWKKCLGGTLHDSGNSIEQTTDGGFIVAGFSYSDDGDVTENHGNRDFWIAKLDSSGILDWQKSLGGSDNDEAMSIEQTTDGGYIVAGFSKSIDGDLTANHGLEDYWITKLDSTGLIEWQKSYGGSGDENANFIQQTTDGGFIVAGFSESDDGDVLLNHGSFDFWILKLHPSGSIEWQRALGGSDNDKAFSVQQSTDGGFIVVGHSYSLDGDVTGNHSSQDFWIVKLDSSGGFEWQKSLGGSDNDYAKSVEQTSDGGYIIAGVSSSNNWDVSGNHGNKDYWLVKLSCNVLQTFYADADSDGYGNADVSMISAACSDPGGYVVDSTDCDDTNANINPGTSEIPGNGIDDNCNGVTDEFVGIDEVNASNSFLSIYPNPASNLITIKLLFQNTTTPLIPNAFGTITITNVLGKTVFEKTSHCVHGNLHEEISLDKKFPQGMYFVKVSSDQQQWMNSLLVVK